MDAENKVMPWGPYRGRTLGEIADTDEGLLYLDRLLGHDWFVTRFPDLATAAADICNRRSHEIDRLIDD